MVFEHKKAVDLNDYWRCMEMRRQSCDDSEETQGGHAMTPKRRKAVMRVGLVCVLVADRC